MRMLFCSCSAAKIMELAGTLAELDRQRQRSAAQLSKRAEEQRALLVARAAAPRPQSAAFQATTRAQVSCWVLVGLLGYWVVAGWVCAGLQAGMSRHG